MKTIIYRIFPLVFLSVLVIHAQNSTISTSEVTIKEWLAVGPIKYPLPAFDKPKDKKFELKELLKFEPANVSEWYPAEGDNFAWNESYHSKWRKISSDNNSMLKNNKTNQPEIVYLATYLDAKRWLKGKLELSSRQLLKVYLDGKEIASKDSYEPVKDNTLKTKAGTLSKEIKLEHGKHILIVKLLIDPSSTANSLTKGKVILDSLFTQDNLNINLSPAEFTSVNNLLNDPKVTTITTSADGGLTAITISEIKSETDRNRWVEIFNSSDGTLFNSYKGMGKISNFQWAPEGKAFTYTTTDEKSTSLWLVNITTGENSLLLDNAKDFENYQWSPDASFIVYSIKESPKKNKTGLKKIEGLQDRWPWNRDRSFLYSINVKEKTKIRLTAGDKTTTLQSISRDGKQLLISTTSENPDKRPYSSTTFFLIDLNTMKTDSLETLYWVNSAQFSSDGKKILFLGGPSLFGNKGITVPDSIIPNEYDAQAYIYDIASKSVDPISRDFNPSINSAYWSYIEDAIYFNTTDRTFDHLYKYDLTKRKYDLIELNTEVLSSIDFASKKPAAVYRGSSATEPSKCYYIDLITGKSKLLFDPNFGSYKYIKLGTTEKWNFKNAHNQSIDGLVYYPPNFDKNKKYPCIVYYYGGTMPTDQAFEGRYPKNLWTANGYIVYVLQPSGAIGYGQNFSAFHVNDWGKTTAEEVIEGTKKFLKEHPFVDPKKVGCIGASYGGFMTMNILTKTDIFAAAISHAGISSISSYWGEGYWGYLYSAIATANSFPWNRKDIYVDDSPLFNANKITTPLLLLHGTSDTNVPTGESTQMFTALKLLGKPVEYIQIAGQNHHIVDYAKRKQWTKTIIAWFDKYLKDQPEWWQDMYPAE